MSHPTSNGMRVPRFLKQPEGEYPAFIRRQSAGQAALMTPFLLTRLFSEPSASDGAFEARHPDNPSILAAKRKPA